MISDHDIEFAGVGLTLSCRVMLNPDAPSVSRDKTRKRQPGCIESKQTNNQITK